MSTSFYLSNKVYRGGAYPYVMVGSLGGSAWHSAISPPTDSQSSIRFNFLSVFPFSPSSRPGRGWNSRVHALCIMPGFNRMVPNKTSASACWYVLPSSILSQLAYSFSTGELRHLLRNPLSHRLRISSSVCFLHLSTAQEYVNVQILTPSIFA